MLTENEGCQSTSKVNKSLEEVEEERHELIERAQDEGEGLLDQLPGGADEGPDQLED